MADPSTLRRAAPPAPKFISGSILRHIIEMTGAGAFGLMAIFAGDLANIYFLSLAGDQDVVAAVGYASSILFFSTSIGIGLSIAATALVSPALGAGRRMRARRLAVHAHVLTIAVSSVLSLALWLNINGLLQLLGAKGRALELATIYLTILLPTLPLLAAGMASIAVLRSAGDARRSMNVTLYGAIANFLLDLIFILHLGWGITGAAIASALARFVIVGIGLYGSVRVHDLLGRPKFKTLVRDIPVFAKIAVPAVLTNVATPVGNAYVTSAFAAFGNDAVAGWAIIGRIMPVAFGALYALSGSVGPIIGQNYGARQVQRMRDVLTTSLWVVVWFTAFAWVMLAIFSGTLADAFRATGDARALIVFFCQWLSPLFVFLGTLFVANAVFNTLGRAHYSTLFNWARATIGTVPFVDYGAHLAGAHGALAGSMVGGIIFGIGAVFVGYRLIADLGDDFRQQGG